MDLAWWIVVPALFMDPFVPVVVLVIGIFVRKPVGEKVARAGDDG